MQPHLDDELEPASAPTAHDDDHAAPAADASVDAASQPDPAAPAPELAPAPAEDPDLEHAPAADEPHDEAGAELDGDHQHEQEPEPAHAPEPAAPTTVAELIAATLRAAGVRLAFTVPGESFLPVLDALQAAGIRLVATRHEGAAAFAAEAYGQLTGRPGRRARTSVSSPQSRCGSRWRGSTLRRRACRGTRQVGR